MDNQGYNQQADHKKSFSNFGDYLINIKYFVLATLRKNPYGIEISKL